MDSNYIWYNSTILKVKETKNYKDELIKEVKIGFRIYSENGTK